METRKTPNSQNNLKKEWVLEESHFLIFFPYTVGGNANWYSHYRE